MLSIVEECFIRQRGQEDWNAKIKTMIPSWGESLVDDPELLKRVRQRTLSILQLDSQQETASV